MTLVQFVRCDGRDGGEPCEARAKTGTLLPSDWEVVVMPNDEATLEPRSQHFCPRHKEGPEHLHALRIRRGEE